MQLGWSAAVAVTRDARAAARQVNRNRNAVVKFEWPFIAEHGVGVSPCDTDNRERERRES